MQQGLQKLDTHVEKAQDKYNTLRNKIDSGEQKIRDNVGMVMGNLQKNKISYDVLRNPNTGQEFHTGRKIIFSSKTSRGRGRGGVRIYSSGDIRPLLYYA